jgi:hypothetical protein
MMDMIIAYIFIDHFIFFLNMKKRALIRTKKNFSRFNKNVVIWILFVFCLKLIHCVANVIFNRFMVMILDGKASDVFEVGRLVYAFILIPTVDFFIA